MDAVEFFEQSKRLCRKSYDKDVGCGLCVAHDENNDFCMLDTNFFKSHPKSNYEDAVKIVEAWVKNNPKKTRLQDFLEKFPNVKINDYGFPKDMCCMDLGYCENCAYLGSRESKCHRCWNEQMED